MHGHGHQHNFNEDAEALHNALKGFFGCDEGKLVEIIGSRTRSEIQEIDMAFRAKYGHILADKIKSETSGHFGRALLNISQTPDVTDAIYLHESVEGLGTNEKVLSEIVGTRDGEEINRIKMAYVTLYRSGAEQAIQGDTSGKYERLLVTLLENPRVDATVHQHEVVAAAKLLFEAPTDDTFSSILGTHSQTFNLALREAFEQTYGLPLIEHIKRNFSGVFSTTHYEDLLIILVTPRAEYFADVIHNALSGILTDDQALLRVITTRYGVDLSLIKEVYQQKYNKTLFESVKSETSGHFDKLLLDLLAHS
jgi:hypothetical protein